MAFKLANCRTDCDGQKSYIVSTDLSALNGLTINGVVVTLNGVIQNIRPEDCWAVSDTDDPALYELSSYKTFYSDCNYCVCGCCTEGIPQASVCADIDMSSVDLSLLGENNVITITFVGPSSTLVLGTITGDFTGFTLAQIIILLVNAVNNGTSGFEAFFVGASILTICTPADLGTTPVGSTVFIEFSPIFIWLNEEDNSLHDHGSDPPLGEGNIGYTTILVTGKPSFVSSADSGYPNDLLYVPMGDHAAQYLINQNFNGAVAPFGLNPYTSTIPAGYSANIYTPGKTFTLDWINFRITGQIISYVGTTLTYNILSCTNAAVPAAAPITAQDWLFKIAAPGNGTVNIYDVDPITGALTYNTFIEILIDEPTSLVYLASENAVYVACRSGNYSSNDGFVKIDLSLPFPGAVTNTVNINLTTAYDAFFNTFTDMFYVNNAGSNTISKINLAMQFNASGNYSFPVPPGGLFTAKTLNPITGQIYYSRGTGPAPPLPSNEADVNILQCNANFAVPDTAINLFTLADWNGISLRGIVDMYYNPVNTRLFVTRYTNTAVCELQSYDISSGVNATINATKLVHLLPAGGLSGGHLTIQPGINKLFLDDTTGNNVYIFDQDLLVFLGPAVPTPNDVRIFSTTDDTINDNYFGFGLNWLTVLHRTVPSDTLFGVFVGDLNCSPCLPDDPETFVRTLPEPVKIFYQIKESNCDINVTTKFAKGYWSKVKELRYGVTSCCEDFDLEALWLNKQLTDISALLIPDITCNAPVSSQGCCPWLPTQACQLIPDPSGGTSIIGVAGEDLPFARLVMLSNDGKFYLNQPGDTNTYQRTVGFVTQTAITNQQVRILISGHFTNTGWSLIPGALYYTAVDGTIVSSVPVTGISQVVGIALSFNTLLVEIRQPIIL